MGNVHTTVSIESTCDDTSLAVVTLQDGFTHVHRMLTYSQTIHTTFGGIVPEYASRRHAEWLPRLVQEIGIILENGRTGIDLGELKDVSEGVTEYAPEINKTIGHRNNDVLKVDSITVASHPGLPGSLISGVTVAHFLAERCDLPLYEVDHIMGHVFSVLLDRNVSVLELPYLCLTVSGGHSDMYIVDTFENRPDFQTESSEMELWHKRGHTPLGGMVRVGPYFARKLTQTMDDAIGEVFDKVSVMLGGPYPGGLRINQRAEEGEYNQLIAEHIRPIQVGEQFSFSGIKAQVKSLLDKKEALGLQLDDTTISAISRRFQECATDALIKKLKEGVTLCQPRTIGVVGGVSANSLLRQKVEEVAGGKGHVLLPESMRYCVDNAAMIAMPALLESTNQDAI